MARADEPPVGFVRAVGYVFKCPGWILPLIIFQSALPLALGGAFLVYYGLIRPKTDGLKRTNRGHHPTVKAD